MSRADLLMLAALGLVFAPLEWLLPIRRAQLDRSRLWTDTLHLFLSGTVIRLGAAAAGAALTLAAAALVPSALGLNFRSQPVWLQYAELLVLADLAFYAAHRLFHAVPFLWRFHEVHHSSEHLDWLATYRVHPVDQILNSTIIALPAVLLGFSPAALMIYGLVYRWHAVWLHSNVKTDLGPLKWLIASPEFHHWHHADEPDAYDRNFGGQLVIFDRLFGTLNLPPGRSPAKYGMTPPIPADYLGQLAHPFQTRRDAPAALAPLGGPRSEADLA